MDRILKTLQLREAGGKCYLIDNMHAGLPYHKPIMINETGAEMFLCLSEGMSRKQTAEKIAKAYHVLPVDVEKDLENFLTSILNQYEVWN